MTGTEEGADNPPVLWHPVRAPIISKLRVELMSNDFKGLTLIEVLADAVTGTRDCLDIISIQIGKLRANHEQS